MACNARSYYRGGTRIVAYFPRPWFPWGKEKNERKQRKEACSLLVETCYAYATPRRRLASSPFLSRAQNTDVARNKDPSLTIPSLFLLKKKEIYLSKRQNSKLIKKEKNGEEKTFICERSLVRIVSDIANFLNLRSNPKTKRDRLNKVMSKFSPPFFHWIPILKFGKMLKFNDAYGTTIVN